MIRLAYNTLRLEFKVSCFQLVYFTKRLTPQEFLYYLIGKIVQIALTELCNGKQRVEANRWPHTTEERAPGENSGDKK